MVLNATNVTDAVTSNASKIMTRNIILLTVAGLIILVNGLCFITLLRDKNLRTKRFEVMTICLSISDILFGFVLLAASIKNLAGIRVPFYCYLVYSVAQSTMNFSMLQMIMICIDRLLATFPTVRNPLLKIPVHPLNLSLGGLCVVIVFPVFAKISDVWTKSCTIYAMAENGLLFGYGVFQPLLLCIVIAILVSYAITIYRIHASWKIVTSNYGQPKFPTSAKISPMPNPTNHNKTISNKIHPFDPEKPSSSYQPQLTLASSNKVRQMSQMAVTLGMLVSVLLVTWLPRIVLGHWFLIDPEGYLGHLDTVVVAEMMVNTSPFFNPIVYVLRIPRFRDRLFSCCVKQSSSTETETTVIRMTRTRDI